MVNSLTNERIKALADMVRDRFGLDFASDRWTDLRNAVVNFHKEDSEFCSSGECLEFILSPNASENDLEQFINRLTIGETYFFRDINALQVLENDILRKQSGKGSGIDGALRIWSAACATGEEPYTLAMICRRSGVKCDIFGTDIDSKALIKAREGFYRRWSFRSECNAYRDIFFQKAGANSYVIEPFIKDMVNLSRLNLMGDSIPTVLMDMDVILCRNVLMYFSRQGVEKVLDKLWDSLNPGGWLLVTPSESGLLTAHGKFEPVNFGSVLLFRKNNDYVSPKIDFSVRFDSEDGLLTDEVDFPETAESVHYFEQDSVFSEAEHMFQAHDGLSATEQGFSGISDEFGMPPDDNGVDSLLQQAESYRERGDKTGAISLYKQILELDPAHNIKSAVLFSIAEIKADTGFLDEAAKWCERAIELDRMTPLAYFLLGQIRLQQGDTEAALAHVRNSVFLDGSFIMAHALLGNIYMARSENGAAKRHFRIALQELDMVDQEHPVPCSDGTTAGRLKEMVKLVQDNLG